MEDILTARFAAPDGYATTVYALFNDMFTASSDASVAASVVQRARRLPRPVGEKMMLDLLRYDVGRLPAALAGLRVPVMVLQTTFSNEQRERRTMREGQTTPYLDMVRTNVPSARIEIIADTGHFPQLDASERTNALIDRFLAELPAR
jgi:pimeloyl-ACP methyl ester carboxylesterase